jgi:hypothetical protein
MVRSARLSIVNIVHHCYQWRIAAYLSVHNYAIWKVNKTSQMKMNKTFLLWYI